MANNILEQIKKNLTKYRKHKRWNKIVSVMMALLFCYDLCPDFASHNHGDQDSILWTGRACPYRGML